MKITISFSTLKDLSDLSNGEKLLDILSSYGLIIEKIDDHEPIKKDFTPSNFQQIWKGRGGIYSKHLAGDFIFKGKDPIRFLGMVSWMLNIYPGSKAVEGVSLWLTIPKKYDVRKLLQLADELFIWSEAVYGYITENSKDLSKIMVKKNGYSVSIGNIYSGISGLMWVNYFGVPYLAEKDFHLPDDHISVGHGAKVVLTEIFDDERLGDLNFLKINTDKIGSKWFFQFEKIDGGIGFLLEESKDRTIKIPNFDNSAIAMQESD